MTDTAVETAPETTSDAKLASTYCTFSLAPYRFAIDVQAVLEVLRFQDLTPVPMAPPDIAGLINLRGQLVTAIDLRLRLGLPPAAADRAATHLVVRDGDVISSLMVDEVGDVCQLAPERHEPTPEALQGPARDLASGVFKLEDGLLLVLDLAKAAATRSVVR